MRILLAVDGSKHSLNAVQFLIEHSGWLREKPQIDLVTVHLPVPKLPGMGAAVSKAQVEKYYQEESERSLADARKKLDAAGVRYEAHTLVGPAGRNPGEAREGQALRAHLHRHARVERARQGAGGLDRDQGRAYLRRAGPARQVA